MAFGIIAGQTFPSDFPIGGIIIWSGNSNNIPQNWALCNGTNGTPDLRDRFVVGAGESYNVNSTGGEASHVLTVSEMPVHNHSGSTGGAGSHSHTATLRSNATNLVAGSSFYSVSTGSSTTVTTSTVANHTHSVSISNAGGGGAHNNMPPYYALCYIMKIA